ncbi:tape measure protein [Pediococcus stilesii]|uniref:tape measure protein n=1 Tax=Pediococcus stilesii TaxID=331679 RepID=UPI001486A6F2|nr:tape measure protein [Pediococcus stilesii]
MEVVSDEVFRFGIEDGVTTPLNKIFNAVDRTGSVFDRLKQVGNNMSSSMNNDFREMATSSENSNRSIATSLESVSGKFRTESSAVKAYAKALHETPTELKTKLETFFEKSGVNEFDRSLKKIPKEQRVQLLAAVHDQNLNEFQRALRKIPTHHSTDLTIKDGFSNKFNQFNNQVEKSEKKALDFKDILQGTFAGNFISNGVAKVLGEVTGSIGDAIKRVDTLNNSTKAYANMGIGAKEAAKANKELQAAIDGLPTSLDAAIGSQKLLTSSMDNDVGRATQVFKALNDGILGFGGTADQVNEAVLQLSQSFSNGKVDAQTWNSMLNAQMGPTLNAIAKKLNMTTGELKDGLSKGKISVKDFQDQLIEMDTKGGGGLKSLQKTAADSSSGLATSLSNMHTKVVASVGGIVEGLQKAGLSKYINEFTKALGANKDKFEDLGQALGKSLPTVIEIGKTLADIVGTLGKGVWDGITDLFHLIPGVKSDGIKGVAEGLKEIADHKDAIETVGKAIATYFVASKIMGVATALSKVAGFLKDIANAPIKKISKVLETANKIGTAESSAGDLVDGVMSGGGKSSKGGRHFAGNIAEDVAEGAVADGIGSRMARSGTKGGLLSRLGNSPTLRGLGIMGADKLGTMAEVAGKTARGTLPLALLGAGTSLIGMNQKNAGSKIGDAVGGFGGTMAGASAGAALGTLIAPGAGTAVGGLIGGIAGSIGGSDLGKKVGSSIQKALPGVQKAVGGFFSDTGKFFSEGWAGAGAWFDGIGKTVSKGTSNAIKAVQGFFSNIGKWFSQRAGDVGKWFSDLGKGISKNVDGLGKWFSGIGKGMDKWVIKPVQGFFKGATKTIGKIISTPFIFAVGLVTKAGQSIGKAVGKFMSPIQKTLKSAGKTISKVWSGIWKGLTKAWNSFSKSITKGWNSFTKTIGKVWNGITKPISKAWSGVWKGITKGWNSFSKTITKSWNSFVKGAGKIWNGITKSIGKVWDKTWSTLKKGWNTFSKTITGLWNGFTKTVSSVWNSVTKPISKAWDKVWSTTKSIWNNISKWLFNFFDGLFSGIGKAWNGLVDIISTPLNAVKDFIEGIFKKIQKTVGDVVDTIKGYISDITDGIGKAWDGVKNWAGDVMDAGKKTLGIKKAEGTISIASYAEGTGIAQQLGLVRKGNQKPHPGGPMLVNDATSGPHHELLMFPNGKSVIPRGRNVLIPFAPKGTEVLNGTDTKRLITPRYAEGTGKLDLTKNVMGAQASSQNLSFEFNKTSSSLNKFHNQSSDIWKKNGVATSKSIKSIQNAISKGYRTSLKNVSKTLTKFGKDNGKSFKKIEKETNKYTKDIREQTEKDYKSLNDDTIDELKDLNKNNEKSWKDTYSDTAKYTGQIYDQGTTDIYELSKYIDKTDDTIYKDWKASWSAIGDWFNHVMGLLPGYAYNGMKGAIDELNDGISGIDYVLGKFGGSPTTISPIKFASGTGLVENGRLTEGTLAMLNDGNDSPETGNVERVVKANGSSYEPVGTNVLQYLEPGDGVLNASENKAYKEAGMPHFADGTGLKSSFFKGLTGGYDGLVDVAANLQKNVNASFDTLFSKKADIAGDVPIAFEKMFMQQAQNQGHKWWGTVWDLINEAINEAGAGGGAWSHSPGPGWSHTDSFGSPRGGGVHDGNDFSTTVGAIIRAVHGGRVTRVGGPPSGWGPVGYNIVTKGSDGQYVIYQEFGNAGDVKVKEGDVVKTGQPIARLGRSGLGTGPHVHIGVSKNYPFNNNGMSTSGWEDLMKMNSSNSGVPDEAKKKQDTALRAFVKKQLGSNIFSFISKNLTPLVAEDGGGSIDAGSYSGGYSVDMIKKAAKAMHTSISGEKLHQLQLLIKNESGGRPGIVGIDDGDGSGPAMGLLQYKRSTFANYALKGHTNIRSAYDQLLAFFNDSNWYSDIGMGYNGKYGEWRGLASGPSGHRRYAAGGKASRPTLGIFGEAGNEYLINPSNPDAFSLLDGLVNDLKLLQPNIADSALSDITQPVAASRLKPQKDDMVTMRDANGRDAFGSAMVELVEIAKDIRDKDTDLYLNGKKVNEEVNKGLMNDLRVARNQNKGK